MTDFIQEVDEDLRHERYKRLWDKYGKFVVAAMVVLVVGIAGSVAYRDWQKSKRAEDTRKLVQAVELSVTDPKLGPDALASLAKSASTGVGTLARLHQAATLARRRSRSTTRSPPTGRSIRCSAISASFWRRSIGPMGPRRRRRPSSWRR